MTSRESNKKDLCQLGSSAQVDGLLFVHGWSEIDWNARLLRLLQFWEKAPSGKKEKKKSKPNSKKVEEIEKKEAGKRDRAKDNKQNK